MEHVKFVLVWLILVEMFQSWANSDYKGSRIGSFDNTDRFRGTAYILNCEELLIADIQHAQAQVDLTTLMVFAQLRYTDKAETADGTGLLLVNIETSSETPFNELEESRASEVTLRIQEDESTYTVTDFNMVYLWDGSSSAGKILFTSTLGFNVKVPSTYQIGLLSGGTETSSGEVYVVDSQIIGIKNLYFEGSNKGYVYAGYSWPPQTGQKIIKLLSASGGEQEGIGTINPEYMCFMLQPSAGATYNISWVAVWEDNAPSHAAAVRYVPPVFLTTPVYQNSSTFRCDGFDDMDKYKCARPLHYTNTTKVPTILGGLLINAFSSDPTRRYEVDGTVYIATCEHILIKGFTLIAPPPGTVFGLNVEGIQAGYGYAYAIANDESTSNELTSYQNMDILLDVGLAVTGKIISIVVLNSDRNEIYGEVVIPPGSIPPTDKYIGRLDDEDLGLVVNVNVLNERQVGLEEMSFTGTEQIFFYVSANAGQSEQQLLYNGKPNIALEKVQHQYVCLSLPDSTGTRTLKDYSYFVVWSGNRQTAIASLELGYDINDVIPAMLNSDTASCPFLSYCSDEEARGEFSRASFVSCSLPKIVAFILLTQHMFTDLFRE